jgi:uncharacterized protein YhaN
VRLLRLQLNAFGPFTNFSVDLSQGEASFHLFWGPNEAGKSSALRALESLFYGMEGDDTEAFMHPASKLSIGADFQASNGDVLSVTRRRGRERSVVDTRGDIIKDENTPWGNGLRALDRQAFQRMFGLNQRRLSEGGKELVHGKGDLGQVLFSAAGQTDLREIQDRIRDGYQRLFIKKGRNQELPQLFSEFQSAKKLLREQILSQNVWQKHEQELASRVALRKQLEELQSRAERRRRELSALRSAKSYALRRHKLRENLVALQDVPRLEPEFTSIRISAERNLAIVSQQIEDHQENLRLLKQAQAKLHPDQSLVAHVAHIESLYRQLGDSAKSDRLLIKLQSDLANFERRGLDALVQLGLSADTMQSPHSIRLKAGEDEDILKTGRLLCKKEEKLDEMLSELRAHEHQLSSLTDEPIASVEIATIQNLEMLVMEIRREENLEREIQESEARLALDKANLERDVRRLGFAVSTFDALHGIPIPFMESIDLFDDELKELNHRCENQQHSHDEMSHNHDQCLEQIQILDPDDTIPSEQQLHRLREERNQAWQEVEGKLQQLVEQRQQRLEETDRAAVFDSLARFQRLLDESDVVADRLRREADRVQRKIALKTELRTWEGKLSESTKARAELESALDDWRRRWSSQWPEIAILPGTPQEGRAWIRQYNDIMLSICQWEKALGELGARKNALVELRQQVLRHLEPVCGNLHEESLAFLGRRLESKVNDDKARVDRFHEQQRDLKQLRAAIRKKEATLKELALECESLRQTWGDRLAPFAVGAETSLESMTVRLQVLREFWGHYDRASDLRTQIEQMVLEKNTFRSQVEQLEARFPRCEKSESEFIEGLMQAARKACEQQNDLRKIEEQVADLEAKLRNYHEDANKSRILLVSLCRQAGTDSTQALPQIEDAAKSRNDLEQRLGTLEEFLDSQRDTIPLDEFCERAMALDEISADQELNQLALDVEAWGRQMETEVQATWMLERNRADRSLGEAAATTAQGLQGVHARMEGCIHEFQKLRLASGILQLAVEQYRQKNEDRLVVRAGELFSQLTCGFYAGLEVEPMENGGYILVGLRIRDHSRVTLEGMSDGTRDQLFLALRIATLEAFLESNEPIPFIADDLLIHFDDRRAIAALQVLGAFSKRTQVLFFTHHQHLVELAQKHLGTQICAVHSFPSWQERNA